LTVETERQNESFHYSYPTHLTIAFKDGQNDRGKVEIPFHLGGDLRDILVLIFGERAREVMSSD
jgi:hypothetical protein